MTAKSRDFGLVCIIGRQASKHIVLNSISLERDEESSALDPRASTIC